MIINNGTYSVYIHQNRINGKRYVGITCKKPEARWGHNGNGYKQCSRFWNAIQKYGWDNFDHEIFASNQTENEAGNMEVILIRELKTTHRDYGYNIEPGGKYCSEEIRKRISLSESGEKNHRYGKHLTDETKKKLSAAHSGKHLPEETKKKISDKLKGKKKTEKSGNQPIPIICVETKTEYPSTAEASRQTNVFSSSITAALKGRQKTAGGFHWKYKNQLSIS